MRLCMSAVRIQFLTRTNFVSQGKTLGPVVSWPILMCATLLFGQSWGFFLKEWIKGDQGLRENYIAMLILVVSIAVTAAAGGVDPQE